MKKAISFCAALLVLATAAAAQQVVPFTIAVTAANVSATQTVSQSVQGEIDTVYVQVPAGQTGDVRVTVSPAFGTLPSSTLYSNVAQSVTSITRPRYVPTDNTGATNLPAGATPSTVPYLSAGDTVTLRVLQASAGTNHSWRAFLVVR